MYPRDRGRWTWTVEQEEYLSEVYGNVSLSTICKRLGKTECSIRHKAKRLGLALCMGRSGMSGSEVAEALGGDRKSITRWIRCGELKARRYTHGGHAYYSIDADDFWDFAAKHRDSINWSRYDRSIIPEPPWVADEVARCKATPRIYAKVTEAEKRTVRSMRLRGSDWCDIAAAIGRTETAVKHIFLRYTDAKYAPVARNNCTERTRRYGQNR